MTEIDIADAAGRTITGVAWSVSRDALVVAFTDGSVATIEARVYAHDCGPELEASTLSRVHLDDDGIVLLGIATRAEVDERNRARRAKQDADAEARERAQYDRLRAKFGG